MDRLVSSTPNWLRLSACLLLAIFLPGLAEALPETSLVYERTDGGGFTENVSVDGSPLGDGYFLVNRAGASDTGTTLALLGPDGLVTQAAEFAGPSTTVFPTPAGKVVGLRFQQAVEPGAANRYTDLHQYEPTTSLSEDFGLRITHNNLISRVIEGERATYVILSNAAEARFLAVSLSGVVEWAVSVPLAGVLSTALVETSTGVYLTLNEFQVIGNQTKVTLLCLNTSGVLQWQRTFTRPGFVDTSFARLSPVATGGGLYVGGRITGGSLATARFETDVVKVDANGNLEWARTLDDFYVGLMNNHYPEIVLAGQILRPGAGTAVQELGFVALDPNDGTTLAETSFATNETYAIPSGVRVRFLGNGEFLYDLQTGSALNGERISRFGRGGTDLTDTLLFGPANVDLAEVQFVALVGDEDSDPILQLREPNTNNVAVVPVTPELESPSCGILAAVGGNAVDPNLSNAPLSLNFAAANLVVSTPVVATSPVSLALSSATITTAEECFSASPEPFLVPVSLTKTGPEEVTLTFTAQAGVSYLIEAGGKLGEPTIFEPVNGAVGEVNRVFSTDAGRLFYQVRAFP